MTDKEKLGKIRSEVIWYIHLRNEGLIIGSCGDFEKLLKFIDSIQEEPSKFDAAVQEGDDVRNNEDLGCRVNISQLKRVAKKDSRYCMYSKDNYTDEDRKVLCGDCEEECEFNKKEEPVSEDLGEYVNELSKQFPEVSFAKLSRIAVRVAQWQKEQFEKNRIAHCDALTEEQAQIESDFVIQHLKKNSRTPTFVDAIEYGMRLKEKEMQSTIELAEDHAMLAGMEKMKEEMMEKAKSGTVQKDNQVILDDGTYIDLDPSMQLKPSFVGLKEGDRIKVIVIKED